MFRPLSSYGVQNRLRGATILARRQAIAHAVCLSTLQCFAEVTLNMGQR